MKFNVYIVSSQKSFKQSCVTPRQRKATKNAISNSCPTSLYTIWQEFCCVQQSILHESWRIIAAVAMHLAVVLSEMEIERWHWLKWKIVCSFNSTLKLRLLCLPGLNLIFSMWNPKRHGGLNNTPTTVTVLMKYRNRYWWSNYFCLAHLFSNSEFYNWNMSHSIIGWLAFSSLTGYLFYSQY